MSCGSRATAAASAPPPPVQERSDSGVAARSSPAPTRRQARRRTPLPCAAPTRRSRRGPSAHRAAAAAAGRRASPPGRRSRPGGNAGGLSTISSGTSSRNSSDAAVGQKCESVMNVPRASCTARRGNVPAGRRQRLLAEVAVHDAQARLPLEEHAGARLEPLEDRGRVFRQRRVHHERIEARPPRREVFRRPAATRLLERPVDGELHRHVPVHRAADARMAAAVVGVNAQSPDFPRCRFSCKCLSINEFAALTELLQSPRRAPAIVRPSSEPLPNTQEEEDVRPWPL